MVATPPPPVSHKCGCLVLPIQVTPQPTVFGEGIEEEFTKAEFESSSRPGHSHIGILYRSY